MQTDRYDYSPIIRRRPFRWPKGARVALMVAPNIEFFHIDKVIPGAPSTQLPDVTGYALRDYGSRIGVFRMMEVLDKHGIRATVLLNADVCAHHPAIIEEGNKRQWEWLGHGVTNNLRMNQYPAEEERSVIRQIRETITAATGTAPRGWLGPGGGDESPNTLDHLAAEGFDYVCDWGFDDQPCAMRVKSGRMIAIPYQQGLNDIRVIFQGGHTPKDWLQMVCDQFDTLYAEGATQGRVNDDTAPSICHRFGVPHQISRPGAPIHLRARRCMESDGCRDRRLLLCQLRSESVRTRR